MKELLLTLLAAFIGVITYSQEVSDVFSDATNSKFEYIELVSWNKALSQKQNLFLRTGKMNGKTQEIELNEVYGGDSGAEYYIQAVNLLGEHGWEIVSRHNEGDPRTMVQLITLFKREVKE